jgi:hypothetical protein
MSPEIILEVVYLPSVYSLPLWADLLILGLSVYGSTFFLFFSVDTVTWISHEYTYLSLSQSCASLHQNKLTGPRQGRVPSTFAPWKPLPDEADEVLSEHSAGGLAGQLYLHLPHIRHSGQARHSARSWDWRNEMQLSTSRKSGQRWRLRSNEKITMGLLLSQAGGVSMKGCVLHPTEDGSGSHCRALQTCTQRWPESHTVSLAFEVKFRRRLFLSFS